MDLLIDRELNITPERLERIYQTIMFYADSVSLRATSQVPNDDSAIVLRLQQLKEIGAIRTWAHEYEVDDAGCVRLEAWRKIFGGAVDQVLPLPEVKALVQQVDDDLDVTDTPAGQSSLREGVAELVQFRQSVIGLRLTDALAADGLLTGRDYSSLLAPERFRSAAQGDQFGPVVQTIISLCTFQPLSDLPLKAIVDCREHMPAFRRYLRKKVEESPDKTADQLAREVVTEYQELLERYAKGHEISGLSLDISWDVVGAILPPAILMKYITKPVEWSVKRHDFRPFLLLSRLRAHQARK
jgi:hypothetical protein